MIKKLMYKYYNKRIITCGNGNVQSYDKEEIKINSTITTNSVAHKFTQNNVHKNLH